MMWWDFSTAIDDFNSKEQRWVIAKAISAQLMPKLKSWCKIRRLNVWSAFHRWIEFLFLNSHSIYLNFYLHINDGWFRFWPWLNAYCLQCHLLLFRSKPRMIGWLSLMVRSLVMGMLCQNKTGNLKKKKENAWHLA